VQQTREQAQSHQRVLLIQDTTDVDYSHHPKTRGLEPVKNRKQHGMLLQTVLAVTDQDKHVLGIMHQEPFLRKPAPEQETQAERLNRERESQIWERSVAHIGPPPEGVEWIHVGDRGSDIFPFFETCLAQKIHFLVRVAQDRCVQVEEEDAQIGRLKELVRALPANELKELDLPATADRKARLATLSIGQYFSIGLGFEEVPPPEGVHKRVFIMDVAHSEKPLPTEYRRALAQYHEEHTVNSHIS
jgi:hypothetical protein